MAISFETTEPNKLLAAFKAAIDNKHVVTWSYDNDGDFTHTPDQWRGKAWLRPVILNGRLMMNFIGRQSEVTTWEVYGVYHGRFAELMVIHCNSLFNEVRMPAHPTNSDTITTRVA